MWAISPVQFTKSFGADVTGVCSTGNFDMVRSIGADRVIDYKKEDFTKNGELYDLIMDYAGNHSLEAVRRVLKPKGIGVMNGGGGPDAGRWIGPLAGLFEPVLYSPFVSQKFVSFLAKFNKADLNILSGLMQSGKVSPVIDRRYKLTEVSEAVKYQEQMHAKGKVVIRVDR